MRPETLTDSVDTAIANTDAYIAAHHHALAALAGGDRSKLKPLVLEEFGYPRDGMAITPGSPVTGRDRYYKYVFNEVADGGRLAGLNFGAGEAQRTPPHETGSPATTTPATPPGSPGPQLGLRHRLHHRSHHP